MKNRKWFKFLGVPLLLVVMVMSTLVTIGNYTSNSKNDDKAFATNHSHSWNHTSWNSSSDCSGCTAVQGKTNCGTCGADGKVTCTSCNGLGYKYTKAANQSASTYIPGYGNYTYGSYEKWTGCSTCGGAGYKYKYYSGKTFNTDYKKFSSTYILGSGQVDCTSCGGDGALSSTCTKCNGYGFNYKCNNARCMQGYNNSWDHWTSESGYNSVCYKTYVITFDPNGGTSGSTKNVTVTYGYTDYYSYGSIVPSRTGYTFKGFYTAKSGGVQVYNASGVAVNGTGYWSSNKWSYDGDVTLYAQWSVNTYTVSYNANGGTGTMASSSVSYNSNFITRKNAFSRAGYTFTGWNEKADGTGVAWNLNSAGVYENGNGANPWKWNYTKNITLYAQWKPNTYTVTYNANGGTGVPSTQSFLFNSQDKISSVVPEKLGYTFVKWVSNPNNKDFAPGDTIPAGWGSFTLNAQWKPNTYTVRLSPNGGTVSPMSINVTYDSTYSNLPTPTRAGYTFLGWKYGDEYITKDTVANKVAGNHTLVAYWEINEHTVTYHAQGGKFEDGSTEYSVTSIFGREIDLSVVAVKSGRLFIGWSLSEDDMSCIVQEYMPDEDVDLYAVYSLPMSDVSKVELHSYSINNPSNVRIIPMNLDSIEATGYNYSVNGVDLLEGLTYDSDLEDIRVYIRIYDHAGNTTDIEVLFEDMLDDDEEQIYKEYVLTVRHYKWNTELGEYEYITTTKKSESIMVSPEISSSIVNFTPEFLKASDENYPKGYANWCLDDVFYDSTYDENYKNTDTNKSYDVSVSYGDGDSLYEEKVVYAYYKPLEYKLWFDPNGGTCDTEYKLVYPGKYIGELPMAEWEGHTFLGWYTERNGGTKISPNDIFQGSSDMTVYAHWEINSYRVIYDYWTNGGTSADKEEATVQSGKEIDLTVKAYKNGWKHIGWNTDPNATVGLNKLTMGNKDITVYAIYEKTITATFIDSNDDMVVTRKKSSIIYNNDMYANIGVVNQNSMTGWESLGWSLNTSATASIDYSSGATLQISDDIVLYGCYTKLVTLSFDTNGSMQEIDPKTGIRYYNASGNYLNPEFEIPDGPEKPAHSFVIWKNLVDGNTYNPDDVVEFIVDTTLTAQWDKIPEITAYDRYFTLEQAQNGEITITRLFEKVLATDLEDGILVNEVDVTIPDYNAMDFTTMTSEGSVTVTYEAIDSFGHVVEKTVTVYIVDLVTETVEKKYYIRYISDDFFIQEGEYVDSEYGGVEGTSIWRTDNEYSILLDKTLRNSKSDVEFAEFNMFGKTYKIEKPGTGTWDSGESTWYFTKEDIENAKEFISDNSYGKYGSGTGLGDFIDAFVDCITVW